MKKYLIIIITLLLLFTTEGCQKTYEDGPWISLRSPEARLIEKNWTIWSYKLNGVEKILEYNDSCGCKVGFIKDETAGYFYIWVNECVDNTKGELYANFELTDKEKTIHVYNNQGYHLGFASYNYETPIVPLDSTVDYIIWNIKKLSNKNLKLVTNYKNNNYEIEFYN